MKTIRNLYWGRSLSLMLLLCSLAIGCKKKNVVPASEKIKKVWIAQTVKENGVLVYTRGTIGNIRNYASFRLDLTNTSNASLTDWDGLTFRGQYELPNDTRLVLSSLVPQPTDSKGTIEFTINSLSDTELDLTRTTASPKTGGTSNQYVLITL